MEAKSQFLIQQIKEIKKRKKLSYDEIMSELTVDGVPIVSRSTVRRVCAKDAEAKASGFNYEETLLPISNAVLRLGGVSSESPQEEEISSLKTVIRSQRAELDHLKSVNDQLKIEVDTLTCQLAEKDRLTTRLIDRLDQKDAIIHQFIDDLKQKERIIMRFTPQNL